MSIFFYNITVLSDPLDTKYDILKPMDRKKVEEYILEMPNSVLEYPFGKETAVYKVLIPEKSSAVQPSDQGQVKGSALEQAPGVQGDWKMYALIAEGSDPLRLSLKCDPQLSLVLREKYETVMPGYHLPKKHWNTIILSGQLPWEEIQGLILLSYNLVISN